MTTKTREEAIEEIDVQILKDIKAGHILSGYRIGENFIEYTMNAKGKHRQAFIPPKPEFKKGTFGKFEDKNGIHEYGLLKKCHSQGYVKDGLDETFSIFTPIYQTDPVEKLAFELMREEFYNSISDQKMDPDQLKVHFLSKAAEELSK